MRSIFTLLIFTILLATVYSQSCKEKWNGLNMVDSSGNRTGYWQITAAMKPTPGFCPEQLVEEGCYENNKKTGVWTTFYPNGLIRNEVYYVNGRPNGKYIMYYDNGCLEETGTWRYNMNIDTFRRYDADTCGKLRLEKVYNKSGKIEGKVIPCFGNNDKPLEYLRD